MAAGWMWRDFPVYQHLSQCAVLDERIERENRDRSRAAVKAMRLREANLPKDSGSLGQFLKQYAVDPDNERALAVCGKFADAVGREHRIPASGFTLAGGYGCGKTTLISALAHTLAMWGTAVRFENVPMLLSELKGTLQDGGFEHRIRTVTGAAVLILDDLGRERVTRFAVDEVLYPIIQQRYAERKPVVVTTNYSPAQLDQRYRSGAEKAESGPAVMERLMERSPWVEIGGESRRKPEWDF